MRRMLRRLSRVFGRARRPRPPAGADGPAPVWVDGRTGLAEAFRTLRANLSFAGPPETRTLLLVTSTAPDDGKSTVVANLGAVLAQAGDRVLVVDCDLRKPTLHRMLAVPNHRGLTNVLVQRAPVEELLLDGPVPGLKVLTSGPVPPNPAELLATPEMSYLLAQLRENYDAVLVDTPPLLAVADAAVLAPLVDGVILVVSAWSARVDMVQEALEQLEKARARILGVVLNRTRVPARDYYYYYYRYRRGREREEGPEIVL